MGTPLPSFLPSTVLLTCWIHSFHSFVGFVVSLFPLLFQKLLPMRTASWLLEFPVLLWICFYISFPISVIMEEIRDNIMCSVT